MGFSTFAITAVCFALLAVAAALVCALFVLTKRTRRGTSVALTVMLALLGGAGVFSLLAAGESKRDLRVKANQMLSLAASAEAAQLERAGRYTTSVPALWRLRPALAAAMRNDGAFLRVDRDTATGSIRIVVAYGFGRIADVKLPAPRTTTRHA